MTICENNSDWPSPR